MKIWNIFLRFGNFCFFLIIPFDTKHWPVVSFIIYDPLSQSWHEINKIPHVYFDGEHRFVRIVGQKFACFFISSSSVFFLLRHKIITTSLVIQWNNVNFAKQFFTALAFCNNKLCHFQASAVYILHTRS